MRIKIEHNFTTIILSWPVTLLLILFLLSSKPPSIRTWIDSYETREGAKDIYETTYLEEASIFEEVFGNHTRLAFFAFNAIFSLFLIKMIEKVNSVVAPFTFEELSLQLIPILSSIGLLFYNPFDPLIKYLPPSKRDVINIVFIIALIIWLIFRRGVLMDLQIKRLKKKP